MLALSFFAFIFALALDTLFFFFRGFYDVGAAEEISLLIVVCPPSRPIVFGIDKIFSDSVQDNVAAGSLLNDPVTADVIAMTMGTDDLADIFYVDTKRSDHPFGDVEIGNIPGIDEYRILISIHKMIGIEVSPFDKEKIFHDLLNRHVNS